MSDPNAFQPFFVIVHNTPALWRLSDTFDNDTNDSETESSAGTGAHGGATSGRLALAVFSDSQRAEQYALEEYPRAESSAASFRVEAPSPLVVVRVLAACVEQGVEMAVLNPAGQRAGRVFDLKAILRRVREQLRAGEPIAF